MMRFGKIKRLLREWLEVETKVGGGNLDELISQGLQIGNNVNLVNMPHFGSEPYLIKIGDETTISFDVAFVTHDATAYRAGKLPGSNKQMGYFGPIIVGKNCFIGCRTIILPNVTIGDGAIIGAGSIVTRDIPAGMIATGAPCKVICSLEEYRDKHLKKGDFQYINLWSAKEKKEFLMNK